MYDYVLDELPALLFDGQHPLDFSRQAIFGHSMGGPRRADHGPAQSRRYRSVSAFAPICSPSQCPWGEKALGAYLGDDREHWQRHDSCALLRRGGPAPAHARRPGQSADDFLEEQLRTHLLEAACAERLRIRPRSAGRTAMTTAISSSPAFIDEHIAFHAEHCRK
jgi:S-formylglutathione hydrolase